jgi:hypothetical protein
MARRRKTKAEREAEWDDAERKEWDFFIPKLRAAKGLADAMLLAHTGVREGEPGRRYYSNLATFLQNFFPPAGADAVELSAYVDLIAKLDAEGVLKPGAKDSITNMLRSAMAARPY